MLPNNDFEQREGRINCFENLAIRQNLAVKYQDKLNGADSATAWAPLYQSAIDIEIYQRKWQKNVRLTFFYQAT